MNSRYQRPEGIPGLGGELRETESGQSHRKGDVSHCKRLVIVLHLTLSKSTSLHRAHLAIPTHYPSISAEAPFLHDDLIGIPL